MFFYIIHRIWTFLLDSVAKTNMTVIITTHYIQEANQSNKVSAIFSAFDYYIFI